MDLITLAFVASQALASAPAPLPVPADAPPTGPVAVTRFARPARAASDTLVEYSAAYYRRLDIHRAASYTMLPLFLFQYLAGSKLYDEGADAPDWARNGHPIAAAGVGVLFLTNTVTGVMNLYEGRKDPEGRGRKVFHAAMMLAADVGFATTGILGHQAANSGGDRDTHRAVALTSVSVATIGYLTMLLRPD